MRRPGVTTALVLVLVGLITAAIGCGGGDPPPLQRSFQLDLRPGKGFSEAPEFEVNAGQEVTFSVRSNRIATVTIEAYNDSVTVSGEKVEELRILADRVGRFPLTVQQTGEDVAYLVVLPAVLPAATP